MFRSQDWINQAKSDLNAMENLFHSQNYSWSCFLAQQAAEKAIKGLGEVYNLALWSHDLIDLLKQLEEFIEIPNNMMDHCSILNLYHIATRYHDPFTSGYPSEKFSKYQAEQAINYVKEVVVFVEKKYNIIEKILIKHPKKDNLIDFLNAFFSSFSAEFIILFGSSAKGNYNYRSDLDLLIISDMITGNYFDRLYKLQKISPGGIDFFIYNKAEFDQMVKNYHLIALEALSEGIILYDNNRLGKKYKNEIKKRRDEKIIQKCTRGWKINRDFNK
ncbi:MAG: HEPN domain-containing protein [Promethearchaeota archaeon]